MGDPGEEEEPGSLVESYEKVCAELACKPIPEFLAALRDSAAHCAVAGLDNSALDDNVAIFALLSLLPFTPIQHLEIASSSLSAQAWLALVDACGKASSLSSLALRDCGLAALDGPSLQQLAYGLCGAGLQRLDLNGNSLGDEFGEALLAGGALRSQSLTVRNRELLIDWLGCSLAIYVLYPLHVHIVIRLSHVCCRNADNLWEQCASLHW